MLMCGKFNEITIILFSVCLCSRAFVAVDGGSRRNSIRAIVYFYCIRKYFDARETTAVRECAKTYVSYTVRYRNTCEITTVNERAVCYYFCFFIYYTIGYSGIFCVNQN